MDGDFNKFEQNWMKNVMLIQSQIPFFTASYSLIVLVLYICLNWNMFS